MGEEDSEGDKGYSQYLPFGWGGPKEKDGYGDGDSDYHGIPPDGVDEDLSGCFAGAGEEEPGEVGEESYT